MSAKSGRKSQWQTPLAKVIEKIETDHRNGLIDFATAIAMYRDTVTAIARQLKTKEEIAAQAAELEAIHRSRAFTIRNDEQHEAHRQVWREMVNEQTWREVKELFDPAKKSSRGVEKHYYRWRAVLEAHRAGPKRQPKKGTWPDAYDEAAEWLKGTPFAGKARTMKEAYQMVEHIRRKAKVGQKTAP